MNIHRLTELALLTAAALILFIAELRFPEILPVPGVKPGLANIITVYAVYRYRPSETAMLVTARILLGAMFSGTPSTLLYSAAGAYLCLSGMLGIRYFIPEAYIWLCSIIGAVLHNTGQLCAAVAVMRTTAVLSYAPILMISGCIAGLLTGICAQLLVKRFGKRKPPRP